LLERFFLGQSQKSLALEHELSHATVAAHCSAALHAFARGARAAHAPVLIVMAAHAARGARLEPAVVEASGSDGRLLAHVPIPGFTFKDRLTRAEHAVAELTIQGAFHQAMARARGTSQRTIANQLAAIYFKVGVSARNELRAKAIVEMSGAADNHRATSDCSLAPAFDRGNDLRVA
jgi:DNA-binding NarL/FixJ family response regulator